MTLFERAAINAKRFPSNGILRQYTIHCSDNWSEKLIIDILVLKIQSEGNVGGFHLAYSNILLLHDVRRP